MIAFFLGSILVSELGFWVFIVESVSYMRVLGFVGFEVWVSWSGLRDSVHKY